VREIIKMKVDESEFDKNLIPKQWAQGRNAPEAGERPPSHVMLGKGGSHARSVIIRLMLHYPSEEDVPFRMWDFVATESKPVKAAEKRSIT